MVSGGPDSLLAIFVHSAVTRAHDNHAGGIEKNVDDSGLHSICSFMSSRCTVFAFNAKCFWLVL